LKAIAVREHQFALPITREGVLRDFIRLAFGIRIPDTVVVPGHSTPWRAFCDAYFARDSVVVWKASRGFGGKSYLLALLGLTEALTLKANVKVLGGSGAQSKNVQDYISTELYQKKNAPIHMWIGKPLATISRFRWGNSIQALLASQTSARGPHPQRLRLDEVDEMPLKLFDAAMGQPMAKKNDDGEIIVPAQTTVSSTHHNPDGTMTEVLRRAIDKGWLVHEWGYQETSATPDGWLLPIEVEEKRRDTSTAMWQVEYDLQEPTSENRAIMIECLDKMFTKELGEYKGSVGEYIEIEKPVKGARYATGADWAKTQDFTVISTWRVDEYPYRLVAFERQQRKPWPAMVGRYERRLRRFRGKAQHDMTGLGSVIEDYTTAPGRGVIMVGGRRKALFSNYIAAIEDGAFLAPYIEWVYNEHKYCGTDDLYGAGHPPDSIVSGALAYDANRHGGARGT
jgi:hypothetical protein